MRAHTHKHELSALLLTQLGRFYTCIRIFSGQLLSTLSRSWDGKGHSRKIFKVCATFQTTLPKTPHPQNQIKYLREGNLRFLVPSARADCALNNHYIMS